MKMDAITTAAVRSSLGEYGHSLDDFAAALAIAAEGQYEPVRRSDGHECTEELVWSFNLGDGDVQNAITGHNHFRAKLVPPDTNMSADTSRPLRGVPKIYATLYRKGDAYEFEPASLPLGSGAHLVLTGATSVAFRGLSVPSDTHRTAFVGERLSVLADVAWPGGFEWDPLIRGWSEPVLAVAQTLGWRQRDTGLAVRVDHPGWVEFGFEIG